MQQFVPVVRSVDRSAESLHELRFAATMALARIYPHLNIRVSRSLDPEKANFLFARVPTGK